MMMHEYFAKDGNLALKKRLTFNKSYRFWYSNLLDRLINVFVWNGLNFPQREIEYVLIYKGFAGFTRLKKSKELGAVNGSMLGVTNYPDMFTTFTYSTPLESGIKKIDNDIVVIDNNQIRMPSIMLVEVNATILAHADLSLQAGLINTRSTGLVKGRTDQQVQSINAWYNGLVNGKLLGVLDEQNLDTLIGDKGIEFFNTGFPSSLTIDSYYQVRENVLKSFYSEIGINSMRDKRERVVEAELDTNLSRIEYSVNDMLTSRQKAAEKINAMFKTNITVDLNPIIKKQMEEPQVEEGDSNEDNDDSRGSSKYSGTT